MFLGFRTAFVLKLQKSCHGDHHGAGGAVRAGRADKWVINTVTIVKNHAA